MKNLVSNLANNQIIIENRETGIKEFYSYNTKIAEINNNTTFIDSLKWNYSRTTMKYLCEFLGLANKKTIQMYINNNTFKLTNLNK